MLADGAGVGFTNHMLLLPADEYWITLAGDGYTPAGQDIVLSGTSAVKPMVVPFTPLAVGVAVLPSVTPSSTVPRRSCEEEERCLRR